MKSFKTIPEDAFLREDETEDSKFYSVNGALLDHLDTIAQSTVNNLISQLITEKDPVILDLMAGWDSHFPASLKPSKVLGLGLSKKELSLNRSLSEYLVHDLNANPFLPFTDNSFDNVICTLSIEYVTKPYDLTKEIGRILKPGGLFLVLFSDRFFPEKATKIWQELNDKERMILVKSFFKKSEIFDQTKEFISRGKQRDKSDIPAYYFVPSDPIYALYANKRGGENINRRITPDDQNVYRFTEQEIQIRKEKVKQTFICPYCDSHLHKWEVPQTPFTEWPDEFQYVCFNNSCTYLIRGWGAMMDQGILGSYRLMYSPKLDNCYPVPVFNYRILRDGIIHDG